MTKNTLHRREEAPEPSQPSPGHLDLNGAPLAEEDEDCTARRAVLCLFLGLPLSCVSLPDQEFEERLDRAAEELHAAPELATFERLRSLPREGHEALLPLLASAIMG